ncbi:MAG: hypothetical protein R3E83_11670 [Burkholderiaceae bacterium]
MSAKTCLIDLGPSECTTAIALLREGFPQVSSGLWKRGFERLRQHPPPGGSGRDGQLLLVDGEVAGLSLEISSRREDGDSGRQVVNLSSWYVRPQARARALWMLSALSRRQDVTITDLSATTGVARMLPALGYRTISHQILCLPLLLLARGARGSARVLDADTALQASVGHPLHAAFTDHRALGCLVNGIELSGRLMPLVWRPKRRMGVLRTVELIYAESLEEVLVNLPVLARALLSQGYLIAEVGAPETTVVDFSCLPYFRRRFAKGPYPAGAIDYLYSEFVYFGFGR